MFLKWFLLYNFVNSSTNSHEDHVGDRPMAESCNPLKIKSIIIIIIIIIIITVNQQNSPYDLLSLLLILIQCQEVLHICPL